MIGSGPASVTIPNVLLKFKLFALTYAVIRTITSSFSNPWVFYLKQQYVELEYLESTHNIWDKNCNVVSNGSGSSMNKAIFNDLGF